MSTHRRDILRILGSASAAVVPASAWAVTPQEMHEKDDQPGHVHETPAVHVPVPSQPTFFQPAEFAAVEALSECIIPRTDTSGAKDAGVALLIDKAIVARPEIGPTFRAGLADLNALAASSYSAPNFAALSAEQQTALLTPLSLDAATPLGKFFSLAKDMTIDAYYKTEIGLKTELGWHGNTYLAEFPGCDHPEHLI